MSDPIEDTSIEDGKNSDPIEKEPVTEDTSPPEGKKGDDSPTFTQNEVNKLLGDVRQKGRGTGAKEALAEIVETLGVTDVDELAIIVDEHKELKLSAMSTQERLETELSEAQSETEQANTLVTETQLAADTAQIKSAIVGSAAGRFADAEVVYKLVSLGDISLAEDGSIVGVDEALDALEEKYPFLRRGKTSVVSTTNPENLKETSGKTDAARRQEFFGMGQTGFWEGRGVRRVEVTEQ